MLSDNPLRHELQRDEFLDLSRWGSSTGRPPHRPGRLSALPDYDNLTRSNGTARMSSGISRRMSFCENECHPATYVDPHNFTNSERRITRCAWATTSRMHVIQSQYTMLFGITNAFFLDSICFGHASLSASARFNPIFATNYSCVAYFRGTNGGVCRCGAIRFGQAHEPASGRQCQEQSAIDFTGNSGRAR